MDYTPLSEDKAVRLSNSPAGTPRLVDAPISPAQSVHLDMMTDNLHGQPLQTQRNANFFDDTSDDDDSEVDHSATPVAPIQELGRRRSSSPRKHESSYLGGATASDYVSQCQDDVKATQVRASLVPAQPSNPENQPQLPSLLRPPPVARGETWYDEEDSTPTAADAHPINIQASGSGRVVHNSSPRNSTVMDMHDAEISAVAVAAVEATSEAIKDIHTQTMQALLQNQESVTSRLSFVLDSEPRPAPHPPMKKRVSMAPPPIDVGAKGSLPDDIVRTPYPFLFRKVMSRPSPLRTSAVLERDSILALSIRQHGRNKTRPRRVSKMIVPANLDAPCAVKDPKTTEKHFRTLDFDDTHFFLELRNRYHKLAGPFRFFSARTLQSIDISHSVTCADSDPLVSPGARFPSRGGPSCTHDFPRSPRFLKSKGLADSFSLSEMMKHYESPKLGKARYAWVHWAYRIASVESHLRSPAPAPPADSPAARTVAAADVEYVDNDDCAAGLEFIEGWCVWRILSAISFVLVLAVTAALCWIFLGPDVSPVRTGYRDAGGRVVGGVLIGGLVLLIGWTGVLGWIGVCWIR